MRWTPGAVSGYIEDRSTQGGSRIRGWYLGIWDNSTAQRAKWFQRGLAHGALARCKTFAGDDPGAARSVVPNAHGW
jgi:hypothetical protein